MVNEKTQVLRTTQGLALYEVGYQNAEISADASEVFFKEGVDLERKQKHGSFNNLEIVNNSTNTIAVDLDGLTTRRRILFGKSSMVIKPDQGIFFDVVKLTDLDSATISASAIALIGRIVR